MLKISEAPIVIVGAGPGGYKCALEIRKKLSEQKIIIIEKDKLGGTCLHRGCIPSKQLWSIPELSGYKTILYKNLKIAEKAIESELNKSQIQVIRAEAEISSAGLLRVDGQEIKYSHLIIAIGSQPRTLKGFETALNSDNIFDNLDFSKYCFIGGGYIGLELASALAFHGKQVRVLEAQNEILGFVDPVLRSKVIQDLKDQELQIETGVQSIQVRPDEIPVIAVGRESRIEIPNAPNIHVIGDASHQVPLAHAAYSQARALAHKLVGEEFNPGLMPYVLFLRTELAWIGLNSKEAVSKFGESETEDILINWASNTKARISHCERGLTKLVIHKSTQEILGCHIWGKNATDLISIAIPIINQRLKIKDLERMIFPHPTIGEIFAL